MKKALSLVLCVLALMLCTACGAEQPEPSPELQPIYESLSAGMPELIVLDEDSVYNYFGIAPEQCAQAVVAIAENGLLADELWLIEAADEAALESIRAMIEMRLEARAEETVDYLPQQYAVIEKAQCVEKGLIIALIISPEAERLAAMFTDALK